MHSFSRSWVAFLIVLLIASCGDSERNRSGPLGYSLKDWELAQAEQLASQLSSAEKAAQLIIASIEGKTGPVPHFRTRFADCIPGAIVLFRYNIADTPNHVRDFLSETQDTFSRSGLPVLFAIDHEGGDVYRMGPVATRLPSQRDIAERYSEDRAALIYKAAARELSLLGIAMNLAPVTEIGDSSSINFLGTRLFSNDSDVVERFATSAIQGIQSAGIIATAKHFPGNTGEDPHTGTSRLSMNLSSFYSTQVEPFRRILTSAPLAILVSHTVVDSIDPTRPFCLTQKGVTGILRCELGYQGLILTDDLSMGAISSMGFDTTEATVLAIEAGCDMVMLSASDIRQARDALVARAHADREFSNKIDTAVRRVMRAKIAAGLPVTALGRLASSIGNQRVPFSSEFYESARDITEGLLVR